jgi:hypothetical protein
VLRGDALFATAEAGELTPLFKLFDGRLQAGPPWRFRPPTRRSSGQSGGLANGAPHNLINSG